MTFGAQVIVATPIHLLRAGASPPSPSGEGVRVESRSPPDAAPALPRSAPARRDSVESSLRGDRQRPRRGLAPLQALPRTVLPDRSSRVRRARPPLGARRPGGEQQRPLRSLVEPRRGGRRRRRLLLGAGGPRRARSRRSRRTRRPLGRRDLRRGAAPAAGGGRRRCYRRLRDRHRLRAPDRPGPVPIDDLVDADPGDRDRAPARERAFSLRARSSGATAGASSGSWSSRS